MLIIGFDFPEFPWANGRRFQHMLRVLVQRSRRTWYIQHNGIRLSVVAIRTEVNLLEPTSAGSTVSWDGALLTPSCRDGLVRRIMEGSERISILSGTD